MRISFAMGPYLVSSEMKTAGSESEAEGYKVVDAVTIIVIQVGASVT